MIIESRKAPEGKFVVIASPRGSGLDEDYIVNTKNTMKEAKESVMRARKIADKNNLNLFLSVYDDKGGLCFLA